MTDSDDEETGLARKLEREHAKATQVQKLATGFGRKVITDSIELVASAGAVGAAGPIGLVAGPIAGAFAEALFAGIDHFRPGRDLGAIQDAEAVRALADHVSELQDRLDALSERDAPPTAGDVAAVLTMYLEASRSVADEKKRRLLTNAVVNAFDPELYEAGLTRRLFEILARLDYPEVYLLREIDAQAARAVSPQERGRIISRTDTRRRPWSEPWSLEATHAKRLVDEGLVRRTTESLGDVPEQHARNSTADLTELGQRLLALAKEREGVPDAS